MERIITIPLHLFPVPSVRQASVFFILKSSARISDGASRHYLNGNLTITIVRAVTHPTITPKQYSATEPKTIPTSSYENLLRKTCKNGIQNNHSSPPLPSALSALSAVFLILKSSTTVTDGALRHYLNGNLETRFARAVTHPTIINYQLSIINYNIINPNLTPTATASVRVETSNF